MDGGSRGNPGPAAAAAVVSAPDGDVLDEASVTLGETTNNVAEYRGLLLGLERARELGATEVEVVNDSELVAKQVNGEYKVKSPEMAALHEQALRALEQFDAWSIRSVPARPERGGRRAREPRARRRPAGGDRVRRLPADRRPARAPAAAHAGGARRAAVHHRPPVLRALVQADPPRAGQGARGARGAAAAGRDPAAQAHGRDRAAAARPPRRARDDGARGLHGVPRPAGARLRLPVAAVPRDRVAQPDALRRRSPRSCPATWPTSTATTSTTRAARCSTRSPSCCSTTTSRSRSGATTTR